jgi:predicted metal-binding protein
MMDRALLEQQLSELPLYVYTYIDPRALEFSSRIRYICQAECPMYGKSWACPPATGEVDACKKRCDGYKNCLLIGTIVEVNDITDINETLSTRGDHEAVTNEVRELMRQQGTEPFILSTEACAECERCAYLDGEPCRFPDRMHPCIESYGINVIPVLEENGLEFQYGGNIVTWYSLLFFND